MKERVKDTGWMGMRGRKVEKKSGREPHQRVWERRRMARKARKDKRGMKKCVE